MVSKESPINLKAADQLQKQQTSPTSAASSTSDKFLEPKAPPPLRNTSVQSQSNPQSTLLQVQLVWYSSISVYYSHTLPFNTQIGCGVTPFCPCPSLQKKSLLITPYQNPKPLETPCCTNCIALLIKLKSCLLHQNKKPSTLKLHYSTQNNTTATS